ncbi:MAG: protoporphyrinogen oxidase [Chloroflexi bacterium]|nr:protoporphyrinogen oxidase [Chloroflexota bacterium]
MHIAIIGGGITGLATAYYLHTAVSHADAAQQAGSVPLTFDLWESAPRFGGKILTERTADYVIEGGPDAFLTQKPAALELCRRLGLQEQLIPTNPGKRGVAIWRAGRPHRLPEGLSLVVPTGLAALLRLSPLSWPGRLRLALDLVLPRSKSSEDESLTSFIGRRLGREAVDWLAEPFLAGVYVADAAHMSVQSTFPRLWEMEQQHGSLIRAARAQARQRAEYSQQASLASASPAAPAATSHGTPSAFMSLKTGIQALVEALVAALPPERLHHHTAVTGLVPTPSGYQLSILSTEYSQPSLQSSAAGAQITGQQQQVAADAVILTTPAWATAELVRPFAAELAAALDTIRHASSATISLAFPQHGIIPALEGYGLLIPRPAHRMLLACTWTSNKFEHRAPANQVLIRAFVGDNYGGNWLQESDAALVALVRQELKTMLGINTAPDMARVYRWPQGNPQYDVGHRQRIAGIERLAAAYPGLHLAGCTYHGVGIPDCIQDAQRTVSHLLAAGQSTDHHHSQGSEAPHHALS